MKQPSRALVRAESRMLGPLVRLLIARGITFTCLSGLLKTVSVAEARKSLTAAGEAPTVSRLSIVTGLQRKDINRIRSAPVPEENPPASDNSQRRESVVGEVVLPVSRTAVYRSA